VVKVIHYYTLRKAKLEAMFSRGSGLNGVKIRGYDETEFRPFRAGVVGELHPARWAGLLPDAPLALGWAPSFFGVRSK
jgi:hypothetical protein